MFGNNKKEAVKSKGGAIMPPSTPGSLNSLVSGTLVEGTVTSENDIRVDGKIKGKLVCKAKVIVGPTGHVDGEIQCKNAVIEGKFEGTLNVTELLNIRDSANVSGDISTNKLIVQSGAVFNVSCHMGSEQKGKAFNQRTASNNETSKEDKQNIAKSKPAAGIQQQG